MKKEREVDIMALKRLLVGSSDFKEFIVEDRLYIDKTKFIDQIINDNNKVILFTRPRRFGKTLFLMTLDYFYNIKDGDKNRKLFKGLDIEKLPGMREQGKYPVITITFKDVKGTTALDNIEYSKKIISYEYLKHSYLLDSIENEVEKEKFRANMNGNISDDAILILCQYLYQYYKEEVVLLIDEYDTPLIEAYTNGFYNEVISFYRVLYATALKDNKFLKKAVITGINRIVKEGMFSGLNNIGVQSIFSEKYEDLFGFTEEDVFAILEEADLGDKKEEARYWYNGYNFNGVKMYNPWSVLYYIHTKEFMPHWINTADNKLLGKALKEIINDKVLGLLDKLFNGRSITTKINERIVLKDFKKPEELWNLMLNAGYLTISEKISYDEYEIKIPNYEIQRFFYDMFIEEFLYEKDSFFDTLRALYSEDIEYFVSEFKESLLNNTSFLDFREEAYYQAYMLGLFGGMKRYFYVKSNREAGMGRYDLLLEPIRKGKTGYVIELKVVKNEKDLEKEAQKAIEQIKEKKYETELKEKGVEKIILIGMAFKGKMVEIKWEKL